MTILHYIVVSSLVVGIVNLMAVLFLSNALFRILLPTPDRQKRDSEEFSDNGLVDVAPTMTYDPRFAPKKAK